MPDHRQANLFIDDARAELGERRARIVRANGVEHELWFRSDGRPLSTASGADPFLLAALLPFMGDGQPVHVHGAVSKRLLANLAEWQAVWSRWRPERYSPVEITADQVVDLRPTSDAAVVAFSGGVDAAYTVHRHRSGRAGWGAVDLRLALLVHGFDIALDNDEAFASAAQRARRVLDGTGIELCTIATNLRSELDIDWEDAFAIVVSAALALLTPQVGIGLIGSSEPYDQLVLPWGSNPITDPLSSSGLLDVRHDGASATRTEKVGALLEWPQAAAALRFCWQGEQQDRNCGECEKCVRTLQNFKLNGVDDPACFDHTPADRILALTSSVQVAEWQQIQREALASGRHEIAEFATRVLAASQTDDRITMRSIITRLRSWGSRRRA